MIDEDFGLKLPEPRDVDSSNAFKNDQELASMLGSFNRVYSRADFADRVEFHRNTKDEVLWVFINGDDTCVGHVGGYKIDHRVGQAEFAVILGEQATWGRGLGTKCTDLAVEHAFRELNLRRVYLDVLATRPRAQHVYEKLGFLVEGRRRQARFEFGQYVDVIELPLMRDDYRCGSAR